MSHQTGSSKKPLSQTASFILLFATTALTFIALVAPISTRPEQLDLKAGQAAPQNFEAPRAFEYESQILTAQARDDAERNVQPIYLAPDQKLARQQLDQLRAVLTKITAIRDNLELTVDQKTESMSAIREVTLLPESIKLILGMFNSDWDEVNIESLSVLQQVMRGVVREDSLENARRALPSLVNLNLSEAQAQIVSELSAPFVIPNSFYSADLTDAARKNARENAAPVIRSFIAGETIVPRGKALKESDIEALRSAGLLEVQTGALDYAGAGALTLLLAFYTAVYLFRRKQLLPLQDLRNLILIAALFLIFFVSARLAIPNRAVIPYLFPLPAFGLLLAVLFGAEAAVLFSAVISITTAYGLSNSLDLTLYYLMASWCGIMVLGPARRLGLFFRAGAASALAGIAVIAAFHLTGKSMDWVGLATLAGASGVNGIASAGIALLLQYAFASRLGFATALQLLEFARPDSPLLQFFLRSAPGTYQHSLQVANLAEQAAEAVNADALLIRVGALYHDCGKAVTPSFYIENQLAENINTHDDIPPEEAARQVIKHVHDGLALAKKHNLPMRIRDFISEHHGTLLTRYQYNRAVEAAGGDISKVNMELFRYPGPIPFTRETAILMLADGVEARARAERPKNETELRALIKSVVDYCQKENQLDNTKLTLRDLHLISEAFVATLRGVYHSRIQYPALEVKESSPTQPAKKNIK